MGHSKNARRTQQFSALLIGLAALFLWLAAVAESGADQGTNAGPVGACKTLIGNRTTTQSGMETRTQLYGCASVQRSMPEVTPLMNGMFRTLVKIAAAGGITYVIVIKVLGLFSSASSAALVGF